MIVAPIPPLAEQYRSAGLWDGRTLTDVFAAALATHAGKLAVVDRRARLTYAQLDRAADDCADRLAAAGAGTGDVVSVQLPNRHEFVVLALAVDRLGAVLNPLTPILRRDDLRSMLPVASPVAWFRSAERLDAAAAAEVAAAVPWLRTVVVVGPGQPADHELGWEDFCAGPAPAGRRPELSAAAVSELIFTSGTSGAAKGVLHTADTLGAAGRAAIACHGLEGDDVFLVPSSLGHQAGILWALWIPLLLGATVVLQDRWDPGRFADLARSEGVTVGKGAPPHLVDLARALGDGAALPDRLHTFFCGGGRLPREVVGGLRARTAMRVVNVWGMTETGGATAVWPSEDWLDRIDTDGRPYPGVEIEIRSDRGDTRGDPDASGTLWIRSPQTCVGYLPPDPSAFDEDGWLDTGDRARLAADGFVSITGRVKDLIIRGGENVPVAHIEDLLHRHPSVSDVALVGVPDARLGERVGAFVVPAGPTPPTLEDLCTYLMDRDVTRQFMPEELFLRDHLPRTASGKVQKAALRALAADLVVDR